MMHDSCYQITKWRNDIWAQPSKQPKNNACRDYAQVLPLWNRKTHFFLQSCNSPTPISIQSARNIPRPYGDSKTGFTMIDMVG